MIGLDVHRPIFAVALKAYVTVRNNGNRTWPALAVGDDALVQLSYRWFDATGQPLPTSQQPLSTRLPADLKPGEAITLPVAYRLPDTPGQYRFQVLLDQGQDAPFELSGSGAEPIPVTVY